MLVQGSALDTMDEERWQRIWDLFHAVVGKPAEERAAALVAACNGDAALRREVEELLANHDPASDFLERPPLVDPGLVTEAAPDELVGTRIGSYRILGVIGEGGMGIVYDAEQEEPVRRRVALKLIKLGMDTREVIGRFESERQALALMTHTNIARIYDAGSTPGGRPYFVMERVAGIPLTEYCDKQRLSVRRRLELFLPVCDAIQHAHQKGIIHRDIKPSNVLVTVQEGEPIPKVIDFGVAKATSQRLTERSVYTELGRFIGTPEYMSPEQAEHGGLDVDTRTDIYSLGVLLYQLLVGSLPFDAEALRSGDYDQVRQTIREEEPPTPSRRLTALADRLDQVARSRRAEPDALQRQLRGDLDWIVMQAMDKDRTRRYETAHALAADIRRHMANEPVLAGAPATSYRMRKFVRRHRVGVAFSATVVVILCLAAAVAWSGWLEARRAAAEARQEAARAEAISSFLREMLASAAPAVAMGRDVSVLRELVDEAAARAESSFAQQPGIEAGIRSTVGRTYLDLGLPDAARRHLEAAYEINRKLYGERHAWVASSLEDLGALLREQGDLEGAESRLREAAAIRREQLATDPTLGQELAGTLDPLTWVLTSKGDFDDAERLGLEALELRREATGPRARQELVNMLTTLGYVYKSKEDFERAADYYRQALAEARKLGDRHPTLALVLNNLGVLLVFTGQYADAEAYLQEALTIREGILDPLHPNMAEAYNNIGLVYVKQGKLEQAEEMYRASLHILRTTLGDDHPHVASNLVNLAEILERRGDHRGAAKCYEEALAIDRRHLTESHPYVSRSMLQLGQALLRSGEARRAEGWLRKSLANRQEHLPAGHWRIAEAQSELGGCLVELGRYAEAEPLLVEAWSLLEESAERGRARGTLERVVRLYERWPRPAEAARYRARLADLQ